MVIMETVLLSRHILSNNWIIIQPKSERTSLCNLGDLVSSLACSSNHLKTRLDNVETLCERNDETNVSKGRISKW